LFYNEIVNDKTEPRIPIPTGIVNDKTEPRIPIYNKIVNEKTTYHLDLDETKIKRAHYALLTGDPERVSDIALAFDSNAKEIAYRREYRTFLGQMNACPVLVVSTGIGGPSTSIAIDELAQIGIHTFIRVGTTGAIQPNINVGDVIITSGAVRLDGASTHYAPIEYPAVSHHEVLFAKFEQSLLCGDYCIFRYILSRARKIQFLFKICIKKISRNDRRIKKITGLKL
jgi:hypothetical protein